MMNISPSITRRSRFKADLLLLIVAVIWGSAFVAQRMAAAQTSVYFFNGLRFLLAAVALALPAWMFPKVGGGEQLGRSNFKTVVAAGMLMVGGAAFQQAGLRYTTAGNAGFITGLYVVLIPVFLSVTGRQRIRSGIWLAALLAAAGLFMLSTGGQMRINPGDALELAGAFFWAGHVIVVGRVVRHVNVLQFAVGQYLVCALVNLLLGAWLEPGMIALGAAVLPAILYTGLISVGVGYTLQAAAQRSAPPADAAIILSSEAVFAALAGRLFLGELLMPIQLMGCAVMLCGMLLAQWDTWQKPGLQG